MICLEKPLISSKSDLNILETVKQINVNRFESSATGQKQGQEHLERLLQEEQTLKNILLFLCSIPSNSNLRLVLQLALIAEIPDEQLELLLVQLQSPHSLESLLLEADILTQILEADGKVEVPLENLLLEAMDLTGLVVPTSLSGTQFLLEELVQNLLPEMEFPPHLLGLFPEPQTLKNILLFLCSIPSNSNLRLVLQLALVAEIPQEQLELLLVQLQSSRSLASLLLEANILTQILEADGKVEIPLENWLLEAMDLTGLVIPTSLSGTQFLLEELAQNLVHDIQIKG